MLSPFLPGGLAPLGRIEIGELEPLQLPPQPEGFLLGPDGGFGRRGFLRQL